MGCDIQKHGLPQSVPAREGAPVVDPPGHPAMPSSCTNLERAPLERSLTGTKRDWRRPAGGATQRARPDRRRGGHSGHRRRRWSSALAAGSTRRCSRARFVRLAGCYSTARTRPLPRFRSLPAGTGFFIAFQATLGAGMCKPSAFSVSPQLQGEVLTSHRVQPGGFEPPIPGSVFSHLPGPARRTQRHDSLQEIALRGGAPDIAPDIHHQVYPERNEMLHTGAIAGFEPACHAARAIDWVIDCYRWGGVVT